MKTHKLIIILTFIFIEVLFGRKILFTSGNTYPDLQLISNEINLDSIYSSKKLGSYIEKNRTYFKLFAPNAKKVFLSIFDTVDQFSGKRYEMEKDEDGVWEFHFNQNYNGKYYGYQVYGQNDNLDVPKNLCVDPYSKAVATYNTYMNPRKSIVYDNEYNWEKDSWIQRDWRDLIIYEMHVRDMTADPNSGAKLPGTYMGLTEPGIKGGINYIKNLGVNTVELLPTQEFGAIELPFKDSLAGRYNTWNPYERNHWGYMTSNYFAPAAYYAEEWKELKWNTWMGSKGDQVNKFKDMVKAFHKEGIAVMMDVVYNHLSEYEIGNLKEIDKEYYFRLDDNGNCKAVSGCGNDLKTERLMTRRLIIDSIIYWMKEYHIDGFRFDLGKMLDWETIEDIIHEAKKINPNVVFVCEPWGGGYDPKGFSLRGWGAWNDQIRNGIKGENPHNGLGWIFGKWYGNNSRERIKSYVNGTLIKDKDGIFQNKKHSVNYLESHDGYTLGDFIRIATKSVNESETISDFAKNNKLNDYQLKLNKLAALFLMTSQGITMIHEGQEYARSKVLPFKQEIEDADMGKIDHNTYNKDNEVNYINYNLSDDNIELVNYYRGLINIRKKYDAFRKAAYDEINFIEPKNNEFSLGYSIKYDNDVFIVLLNANQSDQQTFQLPEGEWTVLTNHEKAEFSSSFSVSEQYVVPPISGVILKLNK